MDATLRDTSDSPSCESLDNISQGEGVSFIAFNEPIPSTNVNHGMLCELNIVSKLK